MKDYIIALRKNIRATYGLHADMGLINTLLESKLNSKIMDEIDAMIALWTPIQLADAIEANAELEALELIKEVEGH